MKIPRWTVNTRDVAKTVDGGKGGGGDANTAALTDIFKSSLGAGWQICTVAQERQPE